jgi:hypothetical protein
MKTIKLNEKEYQFRYSFRALSELLTAEKIKLNELTEYGQDFTKVPVIIHYGIGKELSVEEIKTALDNGVWGDVIQAIELFSSEVAVYFSGNESPNDLKNSNVSGSEG